MPPSLKLAAFERYMLADDRSSHPMAFIIRLQFSGQCRRDAFEAAVIRALEFHPLLRSRIEDEPGKSLSWVAVEETRPFIDWDDDASPMRFPQQEQIDLRKNSGLRIWVRNGSERTEMALQFHHCCCDGIGAYRFIEDLLCAYDIAVRGASSEATFRPLDENRLPARGRFGVNRLVFLWRLIPEMWGIVIGIPIFFFSRPVATQSPEVPCLKESDCLNLLDWPAYTFSEEGSKRLRDVARDSGVTLNDLVLRDWYLTLHEWNLELDPATRKRLIRVMIPINLRLPDDDQLSAANVVAMVPVDRRPHRYRNTQRMLKGLGREMKFLKTFRLGLAFIRACEIIGLHPRGLELLARADRCYASSVLSNLGQLFAQAECTRRGANLVCGELVLERVHSTPPIRPYTTTCVSMLSYANRLSLIINYDRHHFTSAAIEELFARLVRRLNDTAGITADEPRQQTSVVT